MVRLRGYSCTFQLGMCAPSPPCFYILGNATSFVLTGILKVCFLIQNQSCIALSSKMVRLDVESFFFVVS